MQFARLPEAQLRVTPEAQRSTRVAADGVFSRNRPYRNHTRGGVGAGRGSWPCCSKARKLPFIARNFCGPRNGPLLQRGKGATHQTNCLPAGEPQYDASRYGLMAVAALIATRMMGSPNVRK